MENKSSKGMSIGALVCGIVGCASSFFSSQWWIPAIGLVAAIVGIVLGAKAKKAAAANNEPAGMAKAGFILGIIGAALAVVGVICYFIAMAALNELGNQLGNLQ